MRLLGPRGALVGLALALAGAGCAASDPAPVRPPTSSSGTTVSAAPNPTSTADAVTAWTTRCTSQVSYWVTRLRAEPEHSFDYQEMGLSSESYDALNEVLTDAGGRPRSRSWADAQAARRCAQHAEQAVTARTGQNGWP